jgi:hypothetical protein
MRRWLWMCSLSAAVCLLSTASASADPKIARLAAENGWLRDYQQGLAEARRTGKPLFVVFRCEP